MTADPPPGAPSLSSSDRLLSSFISLPENPCIVYSIFTPIQNDSLNGQDSIEYARRKLVLSTDTSSLFHRHLPSVHVGRDPALYVFSITSHEHAAQSLSTLHELVFDGLVVSDTSSFTPDEIYPCSSICSARRLPCSTCLTLQQQTPEYFSSQSPDRLLPRQPLRLIFFHLLEAIRDKLINDFAESSVRPISRLKGGFLLNQHYASFEWGAGWEHRASARPLVHCFLEVILSSSRIILRPTLRPTDFVPLQKSLPIPPGSPVTLIPYATPAYFLRVYVGPTSALTAQFDDSLLALGVGKWKPSDSVTTGPLYIIAWVNVENTRGDEKGVLVIWPMSLCLSYVPSSAHSPKPLSYLPILPHQQQSSLLPLAPHSSNYPSLSDYDIAPLTELLSDQPINMQGFRPQPNGRVFRTLATPNAKGISGVATEVGAYVDAVAKDREKERERIRRERENAISLPTKSANLIAENDSMQNGRALLPAFDMSATATPIQQHPGQHFYPSPPQSNLPSTHLDDMQSSPNVAAVSISETVKKNSPQSASSIDLVHSSASRSFDPFGNFASSWSQPPGDDFMNIDFGMGLTMDMDPITGGGRSAGYEDSFTDDDFSFFDRPSKGSSSTAITSLDNAQLASNLSSGVVSAGLPTLFEDIRAAGLPVFTGSHQLFPSWGGGLLCDPLAPEVREREVMEPEVPPHSGPAPWTQSAPASPSVQLSHGNDHPEPRRPNTSHEPSIFDPIPFASSHRLADGKYVMGKFALPSPPAEDVPCDQPPTPAHRLGYTAMTDPRVGMVRRLQGVKNESLVGTKNAYWAREREEWVQNSVDAENSRQETGLDDVQVEENDSPMTSRVPTPPLANFPLGPALLHTKFQHCHLLPLSMSLRPPGAAVTAENITSPPAVTSVPTPVSPAAVMGVDSEKSKSLEATALAATREIVENCVWARAWRANIAKSSPMKPSPKVWQADVKAVNDLLESVPILEGPLDLCSLLQFECPSTTPRVELESKIKPLKSPMISVGASNTIVQILSSALHYWEKLGLRPRGGKKDVTAFVFFEEEDEERQQQIENWFGSLSAAYSEKSLGRHVAGTCSMCATDGVVPLRYDAFRKNIFAFIRSLTTLQTTLVLYIVMPPNAMTLDSSLLRQVFSTAKRVLKAHPEMQIIFQFVPAYVTTGSLGNPASHDVDLDLICFSVYNRILQPVDRLISRRFSEHAEKDREYIYDPAFALARPPHSNIALLWQAPARSLDVVDRHALLHVGYQVTPCGKWILAASVDQRGEAHDIGVWLTEGEPSETNLVSQVWDFALQFARKASVEWRVAIAKLGPMGGGELEAWMMHLRTAVPTCRELSTMHVSIFCVEPDVPWRFVAPMKLPINPRSASSKDHAGSIFLDGTASNYILSHNTPIPLSPVVPYGFCLELPFVSEINNGPTAENLSLLPLSTTTLVRVSNDEGPAVVSMLHIHLLHTLKSPHSSLSMSDKETHLDITRNYHDLAVLAGCRWNLDANPLLPFHLAAVDIMHLAFGPTFD